MSSPTDTNQASEELETKVTEIVATIPMFTGAELNEIGWEKYGENEQDAITNLLELIRTEKLKLLAEVRERRQTCYDCLHDDTDYVSVVVLDELEAEL